MEQMGSGFAGDGVTSFWFLAEMEQMGSDFAGDGGRRNRASPLKLSSVLILLSSGNRVFWNQSLRGHLEEKRRQQPAGKFENDVMQQREKSWFASSLRSRMQYLSPDMGLPSINEKLPKNISLDPSVGPVGAFCLLVLNPEKAMGICKRKVEPSMLDMVLREKLDEITLVTTKGNVQREGTRNGGNVSP
ncbi:hypothetical protein Cgig2_003811 [Carnegiea gigantea]|uniref:Uncharacterized protein n=1 Tax=Carnegiea gigantea TaxID=171969 RepID=A0A9Q1K5T5_9CARY|nr:hypothetical protein Cgig2_003811 [Carnegiea gigantea]